MSLTGENTEPHEGGNLDVNLDGGAPTGEPATPTGTEPPETLNVDLEDDEASGEEPADAGAAAESGQDEDLDIHLDNPQPPAATAGGTPPSRTEPPGILDLDLDDEESGRPDETSSRAAPPIPPPRPRDENSGTPGPAGRTGDTPPRPAPESQPNPREASLRRRLIRAAERQFGTTLNPEQERFLLDLYFDREDLDAIDQRTLALFRQVSQNLNLHLEMEEPTTAQDKIARWFNKNAPALKRIAKTALASTVLRSGIKLASYGLHTPWLSFGAGTITGAVIGGTMGKWRAEERERKEQYGYTGIVAEYTRILNDQTDPNRESNAIAFIEQFLLSAPSQERVDPNMESAQVRKNELFSGNYLDLLKLSVFYNNQARRIEGFDPSRLNAHEGSFRSQEFRTNVRHAAAKAGIAGMKRGALIGAGLGFVSDAISFGMHWIRSEHAYASYLDNQTQIDSRITSDVRDSFVPNSSDQILQYTPDQHSDWSIALARAMKDAVDQHAVQIPKPFLDEMAARGITDHQEIVNQFAHNFNYAQALQDHIPSFDGQNFSFNAEGLQELANRAVTAGPGGTVDYQHMAQVLGGADDFLTRNFPPIGHDYTLSAPYPFEESILHERATNVAEQALHESGLEQIVHGAGIGAGISATQGEKSDNQTQNNGTRNEHPSTTDQDVYAEEAGTQEEQPAEQSTHEEAAPPEPEIEIQPITTEQWLDSYRSSYIAFTREANSLLKLNRTNDWSEIAPHDKGSIANLVETINSINAENGRFKIKFNIAGRECVVNSALDPDTATATTAEGVVLNLSSRNEIWPEIEFTQNREPDGDVPLPKGMFLADLDRFNRQFAIERASGHDYKVTIQRALNNNGAERKIWQNDPLGELEILSADTENNTVKVATEEGIVTQLSLEQLQQAAGLKLYFWQK